jgi:hypothetical protein
MAKSKDFTTVKELAVKLAKELNLFIEALDSEETPKAEPACELVPITLEEVRTVLAELSRDGKTQEVKAILKRHGASRLSEVNPDEWEAILDEAAEIRHGS